MPGQPTFLLFWTNLGPHAPEACHCSRTEFSISHDKSAFLDQLQVDIFSLPRLLLKRIWLLLNVYFSLRWVLLVLVVLYGVDFAADIDGCRLDLRDLLGAFIDCDFDWLKVIEPRFWLDFILTWNLVESKAIATSLVSCGSLHSVDEDRDTSSWGSSQPSHSADDSAAYC